MTTATTDHHCCNDDDRNVSPEVELIRNGGFEVHGHLQHGGWGPFREIDAWDAVTGYIEIQRANYGTGV